MNEKLKKQLGDVGLRVINGHVYNLNNSVIPHESQIETLESVIIFNTLQGRLWHDKRVVTSLTLVAIAATLIAAVEFILLLGGVK